jgi:GNAT superfamily N-acetyltransferase
VSAVSVRRGGPGDGPVLLSLVEALARYERLPPPDAGARERLMRDGVGPEPRYRLHIGELDGRPVGYALWLFTYSTFLARPTLWLEDLFVEPDARAHGVGGALLGALGQEAVAAGCGRMEWAALTWNRLAIDFYERLGARALEEWRTFRLEGDAIAALAARDPRG